MIVEYYHHPPVLGMTWWLHKEVIRTTSDYKIRLGLLPGSFPAIPTGRLLILDFPRTFENGCKYLLVFINQVDRGVPTQPTQSYVIVVEFCRSLPRYMAKNKVRCTCQVYRCNEILTQDSRTNLPSPGRLLAPSTVHQHRRDDKIWHSARQGQDIEVELLTAAARSPIDPDPVVSSKARRSEENNQRTIEDQLEHIDAQDNGSIHGTEIIA